MPYRTKDDQDEGDVHTGTRVCRKCGTRKPMEQFHWTASKKHRSRTCKTCAHDRQKEVREEYSDEYKAAMRSDHLRREYGLSQDAVEGMRAQQGDMCALCGKPLGIRFHIDHDHATGFVRDLLCHNCNLGLGHFYDDPELLLKAAEYVRAHRERMEREGGIGPRLLTRQERAERRRTATLKQHASERGRAKLAERSLRDRGESAVSAKLTEEIVREIRAVYSAGGVSQRELAERFGVKQTTISHIITGKSWSHVE